MPKIKVLVHIKNSEEEKTQETNAILQDNTIKYKEDETSLVIYNYKENKLIRETNELRMTYQFEEGKTTTGNITLKDLNKEINIEIYTKKIIKKENNIEIEFEIEKNLFLYRIEVIE